MELKDYLLEEKYHPKSVEDIVLPNRIKSVLKGIIDSGNIAGYIFSGSPGTGKTTSAIAICKELGLDHKVIEGSVNNGVDYVRNVILETAQMSSSDGRYSVIIIDEFDYFSKNAMAAMRNVINMTQKYCRFIMTANYPEKIIPAIRGSRLVEINFNPTKEETLKEVAPLMWKRMNEILKAEQIKVEDYKTLQKFMVDNLPNIRYILKCIQILGSQNNKTIPTNIAMEQQHLTVDGFREIVKGTYENMVKFVYNTPQEEVMKFFQENVVELVKADDVVKALTIASQFQSMNKGVEELYTISFLMNLKTMI